ncbi:MAG: Rha family transcriptional regulator, partial [Clostridiales bacterium]|nr:Rha family transcriptional regulator [Clostridiales bacterium]
MHDLMRTTITSMEAAEWCGKEHSKLLRDIRNYISQLGEAKIGFSDFFNESTYVTEQNKTLPCFLVTKKGCEFIAHKMTGQRGTEFTARYINRFHEMENPKKQIPPTEHPGEVA